MRVVVVREYTDKYTGEGHVIGEKLDMTEERFAEIQDKGMFVVDISDEAVQQETVEPQNQDKPARGGRRNRLKKESEDK